MTDVVTRLHPQRSELNIAALRIPAPVIQRLVDADVGSDQLVGLLVWLTTGLVLALTATLVLGAWTAISIALLITITPGVLLIRWSGRRDRRMIETLPLFVEALARSLRSGASFAQALAEAAHESPAVLRLEVQAILVDIERGRAAPSALRAWVKRTDLAEVRIVAAALAFAIQHESGASQSLAGIHRRFETERRCAVRSDR